MTQATKAALQWSAQFSARISDNLAGDKITLPPSALEDLLYASSNLARDNANRDLPPYDPYNSASFSAHQRAESQYQDQIRQLPHPLTFRLVNPDNGWVIYAGVREFSAEDGQVMLSRWVAEALGVLDEDAAPGKMNVDTEDNATGASTQRQGQKITVQVCELPKGTFVKLRPLEAGYDPADWKALLEQYLRANYTTLTSGEVLIVPVAHRGMKKQEFRFLVDGFKPDVDGVCIVDTDLEVDIEALNEEQARETLKQIAAKLSKAPGTDHGSSAGGEIDVFKVQDGQILPGEYVDYQLPSWNRTMPIEIEMVAEDDEETLDLFVSPYSATQRSKPRIDEFVFAADLDGRPKKRIRLEPSNAELENAEALFISVHAFTESESASNGHDINVDSAPKRFTLTARHPEANTEAHDSSMDIDDVPPNEDEVRCKNCGQWVPQRTLMLHENFCLRNNILCPRGCGQVFQKRSPAFEKHWHCPYDEAHGNAPASQTQHNALFHPSEVLHCSDCATQETFSTVPALARHRTTTCPAKTILCRFCHLEVSQEGDPDVPNAEALLSGMTPHELADGARTTECHLCAKIVRLRDMEVHLKNHDLDRLSRPPPVPCRNVYCGRTRDTCPKNGDTRAGTRMGQGPGNDIELCSTCFGPLYVNLYDPDGKAMRRRIERRYLQQLITGCGKAWCKNEYCKAGRTRLGLNNKINMKDGMVMVKPIITALAASETDSALHFCVDKKSQQRREVAAMLAAEDGGFAGKGGYELDWCIGALEAENGNLDAARTWLKNWAPARGERRR